MTIIRNYGPTIKAFLVRVDGEFYVITQYFTVPYSRDS
jgi:hypothetical protein